MARTRGAFRYPVDLRAWLHLEDRPASPARVIDLSRTGAGLRLTGPAGFDPAWVATEPLVPVRLTPGEPVRLAVVDLVAGRPVTRQWCGRVAHARDEDEGGDHRIGLVFPESAWGHTPNHSGAEGDHPPALVGIDELLHAATVLSGVPSFRTGLAASALAADQLSKAWAWASLGGSAAGSGVVLPLVPNLLDVLPAANAGTVASLGEGIPLTARVCALGALVLAALAPSWLADCRGSDRTTEGEPWLAPVGTALLTAGLLGNSIDRLALGYVRDFLVSGLCPEWTFNLADLFLLAGTCILLLTGRPGWLSHSSTSVHPEAEPRILI